MTTLPKYMAKQLEAIEWPQLLICREKHTTDYYLLADIDALWTASLAILRDRVKNSWIVSPGDEPYGIQPGELPQDEISKLPAHYRKQAEVVVKANEERRLCHTQEVAEWKEVQQTLKENDGMAAYIILRDRNDNDGESFILQSPSSGRAGRALCPPGERT